MKKTSKKLTTLLTSAILVFGSIAVTSCSNDSDDNPAKILAAASANTNSGTSTTNNNNNNNDTNNDNNNNNTNNDNNNTNNNTPVVTQTNKYLFAEAVEEGILFTIKTLPTEKRPDWVGIYDENGSALIVNSWNDKTQDWTGLYPFISSGEKRIFTLYTDTGISEKVTVTAKGGKGSLTIPEGLKPTLNVTSNNITVEIPATYSKSLLPSGATANNLQIEIYTEDGTPFGWLHIYDLTNNPTSFVFTNDFNEIKNNWKTKYNDKKIFTSVFYNFTTTSGSYRLIKIESDSQTPTAWQTNNTNNNTPVVTQTNKYLFAEAVEGGIKLTIKVLPTDKRDAPVLFGLDSGAGFSPYWTDRSKDWTGIYPFVSSGETRRFDLWSPLNESVTVTAIGGKGSLTIPEGLKPTLIVKGDKITVGIPAAYSKYILPYGTYISHLQIDIQTEDGNTFGWTQIYNLNNDPTSYEFNGENFEKIKNEWKTKYIDKKIHTSVFYVFTIPNYSDGYRFNRILSDNQIPSAWK